MGVIKLIPACKDYMWGGNNLREKYNIASDISPLAESWMLSTHKDGESIISDGEYKGYSLSNYIKEKGKRILGTNCEKFKDFPILIKLIDAKDNLSIQVHPDNEYALKNEGQYGKTEMWYFLEAEPNAYIYYGFKTKISKEEFKERIKNNTLLEVLNKVFVKKGDVFFIEPGTLHGICRGVVLAEIQQNSNITYRVYDYARTDANGKGRELHIDKAIDVTNLSTQNTDFDFEGHLAKCKYFTTDIIIENYKGICDNTSFISILITKGKGKLICEKQEIVFNKGESYFLEAGSGSFELSGDFSALITHI